MESRTPESANGHKTNLQCEFVTLMHWGDDLKEYFELQCMFKAMKRSLVRTAIC